jgi:hypothetical protein
MKKKMRKFSEGGFETAVGQSRIDEDTRARGMRSVMPDDSPAGTSTYGEENASPVTVTKTKTSVTAPAKPKVDAPYSKPAGDYVNPEKGLERVEPENYVPGPGMIKNLFKMGAQRLAKNSADDVASAASRVAKNDAAEMAVRNRAAKVRTEANDAAETAVRNRAATVRGDANDAASTAVRTRANKVQNEANDIKEAKLRVRASKTNDAASKNVRDRANKVLEGKKAGGIIRSSASRRADGCAIRGKTRA